MDDGGAAAVEEVIVEIVNYHETYEQYQRRDELSGKFFFVCVVKG